MQYENGGLLWDLNYVAPEGLAFIREALLILLLIAVTNRTSPAGQLTPPFAFGAFM
jgi:hypothetical protein